MNALGNYVQILLLKKEIGVPENRCTVPKYRCIIPEYIRCTCTVLLYLSISVPGGLPGCPTEETV